MTATQCPFTLLAAAIKRFVRIAVGKSTMTEAPKVLLIEESLLGYEQKQAVECAAHKLCELMRLRDTNECNEIILNEVWPALKQDGFTWDLQPLLELKPLDRLGGEPGLSGNTVVAGLFSATAKQRIPSRQMIIKISPDFRGNPSLAREKRDKLIDESKAAFHLFEQFRDRMQFARPVWLSELGDDKPAVLWAPFESPDPQYILPAIGERWQFAKVDEIVKYLSDTPPSLYTDLPKRKEHLKWMITVIKNLANAHETNWGRPRESVNLLKHYERELRGFPKPNDWGEQWRALWRKPSPASEMLDPQEAWPNPADVYKKLVSMGHRKLRVGCVHGDLHPRNIVFGNDGKARVIDFGWAEPHTQDADLQHIVKDFVLLEANLRFMTLPSFLPYNSVKNFADWVSMDEDPPSSIDDEECELRIGYVKKLRDLAKEHIGNDHEHWDIEYIVPLFLVSLGLLRHCSSATCQWAARYTVRKLAAYLEESSNVFT